MKYIAYQKGEKIAEANDVITLKEQICKYLQIISASRIYLSDLIVAYGLDVQTEDSKNA